MIDLKMYNLGTKRSVIRECFEYARHRKAEIGEENVFDFSLGNPSVPSPASVTQTMEKLLKNTDPVLLHGYTSAQGDASVRRKIAESIEKRFKVEADPDLIYMTCGAAASLAITLRAIVTPGDNVIVPAPFFPEYRVFAESVGAKLIPVPCKTDFQLDVDAIERAVTNRTKAVIINSPNNPTGAVFTEESIKRLSDMLKRKIEEYISDIFIIADEPYRELCYDGEPVFIPKYYPDTFVCYSYSKAFSLPGERIGYIYVPPVMESNREIYAALCGAGRALGYVCAPSLMQYTVAECVDVLPDLTAYRRNRDLLYGTLTEYGYTAVKPEGAFYLFVKSPEPDAAAFCERARKYELILVPSDDFGCEGYVRIAYCVSTEQIKKALPAFKALIEEYK